MSSDPDSLLDHLGKIDKQSLKLVKNIDENFDNIKINKETVEGLTTNLSRIQAAINTLDIAKHLGGSVKTVSGIMANTAAVGLKASIKSSPVVKTAKEIKDNNQVFSMYMKEKMGILDKAKAAQVASNMEKTAQISKNAAEKASYLSKNAAKKSSLLDLAKSHIKSLDSQKKGIQSYGEAQKKVSAITKVATAIQGAFNVVSKAIPIILIITGIAALIAIIVILFNKCKPFHDWVMNAMKVISETAISIFTHIGDFFQSKFESIKGFFKGAVNTAIDGLNFLIQALNKIHFDIPSWVPIIGGKHFGPNIPTIPKLARGGIIDSPTFALLGESGKEAVVPLENTGFISAIASAVGSAVGSAAGCGKGIGGGAYSTSGTITINGGCVTANGIGTGQYGESQATTITGGAVLSTASINQAAKSNWNGLIFDNNIGLIYGNSSFTFPNFNFEISNGASLTVTSGQTLTIPAGMTLTNNGTLTVQDGGTLNVRGDAAGSGTLDAQQGSVVNKRASALSAPEIASITIDRVTLKTIAAGSIVSYGYRAASATSVDNWQASPVFTGLQVGNSYVFFARSAGNGYYESGVSDGTSLTVSAPPAVTVADMSANAWTLTTTDKMEYSTDNGTTWKACTAGMAATAFGWNANSQATQVLFRYASNDNPGSIVQTYTIPGRCAAPAVTIDYASDTATVGNLDSAQYSTDGGSTWISFNNPSMLNVLGRRTDRAVTVLFHNYIASASPAIYPSAPVSVTIAPKQTVTEEPTPENGMNFGVTTAQGAPAYHWQTVTETVSEPLINEPASPWTKDSNDVWHSQAIPDSFIVFICDVPEGGEISMPAGMDLTGVQSDKYSFVLNVRVFGPGSQIQRSISQNSGVNSLPCVFRGLAAGQYSIEIEFHMQADDGNYSLSTAWCKAPVITAAADIPGATSKALTQMSVPNGTKIRCVAAYRWGEILASNTFEMPAIDTLSAAVPAFDAVNYGYAQPAAKAVTINSTGNTAAAISSVTVSDDAFTVGSGFTAVTAGGANTTWTIQPKAGLSAGNYNGTVTVTYNGGKTAKAKVGFTVNKAAVATPEASVDAVSKKLTGLVPGAVYLINGKEFTANNGEIAFKDDWLGKTISLVRQEDANHVSSAAQILAIPAQPKIIRGMNVMWTQGVKDGLEFASDADYDDYLRTEVDGKTVPSDQVTVRKGSTVVTLSAEYLGTLSVGKHTLSVVSKGGAAQTQFEITAKPSDLSVKTGDHSIAGLWITLLALSAGGLTALSIIKKRKKTN